MFKKLLLTSVLTLGAISPAMAELNISGNVGLTTDYVFRGVSQTDESAAVQGSVDFNHDSGLHAGVWASNIDFNNPDDGSLETDIYAGFANEVGGFTYDVGGIYYAYPGSDSDLDYDYVEAYINGGYDFGVAAVKIGANYSPNFFGDTGDSLYTYANVDVPLPSEFGLAVQIGHQEIDDSEDYTHWSLGVNREFLGFDWAATYHDTNLDDVDEGDARGVLSVSKSF